MKAFAVLIFAWGFACAGAVAESPAAQKRMEGYWERIGRPTTLDKYWQAAAEVDVSKPIGEYEAFVLASAYFQITYGGCGGIDMPKRKGDFWVAKTRVGYTGVPGEPIWVNRKTGATVAKGFSEVTDPKVYLERVTKKSKRAASGKR